MNKKLYLMIISIVLLFPIVGHASDNAIITCNKTKLKKNEETICQLKTGNLGYEISSFQGKITLGDNLSLVSSSYDSDKWMYFGSNFSVADIELATKNSYLLANNLLIATFKIKAGSNAIESSQIFLSNVKVSDKNYSSKTLTYSPIDINFLSSVNTLSSLNVDEHELDFNADITTYSFNTDLDSITISATPDDLSAKVSGTGKIALTYGENKLKIVVTAEDGSKKEYKLNVTRNDNRSSNNSLKSLSISNEKINFSANETKYDVEVDSAVEEITINAELSDSKANFVQEFGPRKVALTYGINKILIKVKSENEQEKVYEINITRKDGRSSNNLLKEIELSSGKLTLNNDTFEYRISVPYETQNLNINAIADDTKSTVEIIGEKELSVGENIFIIKVTAENEDVKEYRIIVTREEKIEITSSNKLKNIEISEYEIDFNPDEYYYVVKTNNRKLNIKVTLQDSTANYKIIGNDNLEDGSIISIVVTDKNGNSNVYKLVIVQELSLILYIMITLLLIIISVCVTIFIIKNKKRNNKNQSEDFEKNLTTNNSNSQFASNISETSMNDTNQFNSIENRATSYSGNNSLYNNVESIQSEEILNVPITHCRNCNGSITNGSPICPWCGSNNN